MHVYFDRSGIDFFSWGAYPSTRDQLDHHRVARGHLIAVSELADSSVNFVIRSWVKAGDYSGVMFDLTEAIKKRFDKEGISFPYPQQDVHLYNTSYDPARSPN